MKRRGSCDEGKRTLLNDNCLSIEFQIEVDSERTYEDFDFTTCIVILCSDIVLTSLFCLERDHYISISISCVSKKRKNVHAELQEDPDTNAK